MNGNSIGNVNNGMVDLTENVTVMVCDVANNITLSAMAAGGNPDAAIKITYTTVSNISAATTPADADFRVGTFNSNLAVINAAGGLRLDNPNLVGQVVYTAIPYHDANVNGLLDVGECTGEMMTVTVVVNPRPAVMAQTTTVCSDVATGVTLGDDVDGPSVATYNITMINMNGLTASAGSPATGMGLTNSEISNDAYTNTTSAAVDVVYTIVPVSAAGCEGEPFTVTVTVNPEPLGANDVASTCSDIALNVDLQGDITNGISSNFTWTIVDNPNVTGESAGSGDNITQILTNLSSTSQTVVYTVTPTSDPDGCVGNTFNITVTVNPEPIVNSFTANETCSRSNIGGSSTLPSAGTNIGISTYTWVSVSPDMMTATGGNDAVFGVNSSNFASPFNQTNTGVTAFLRRALINNDQFLNVNPTTKNVVYRIIPIGSVASGTCVGDTFTVTVPINPQPAATGPVTAIEQCSGVNYTLDFDDYLTNVNVKEDDSDDDLEQVTYTWTAPTVTPLPFLIPAPIAGSSSNGEVTGNYVNPLNTPLTLTYTVTPISVNGCAGAPFTVSVVINPNPEAIAFPNGDLTLCEGEQRTLNGGATPSGPAYIYNWSIVSGSGTLSDPNIQSPILTAGTPTGVTVQLKVTNPITLCSDSTTLVFTIDPIPSFVDVPVDIYACASVLNGNTAVFDLTESTDDVVTFHLSAGDANDGIGALVNVTNYSGSDGQVVYVRKMVAGCFIVDEIVLNIYPLPTPVVTASELVICSGETVTLTLDQTYSSYIWSTGSTMSSIMVSPLTTTTYSVTVEDANGCANSASVTITISTGPQAPVVIGNSVCTGSTSGVLTAECESLTCTVNWYDQLVGGTLVGTGLSYDPIAEGDVSSATAGTHNFYAECSCDGCISERSLAVLTINAATPITITPAGPFCQFADPVNLSASVSGGTWSGPGITNANTGAFNPNTAGPGVHTITYTYVNGNLCTSVVTTSITVTADVTEPAIANCPGNQTATVSSFACFALPTWIAPTATDDCKLVSFTNNVQPFYTPGVHTIIYTATDAAGLVSTCSFTFTVTDMTAPNIFGCLSDTIVSNDPGVCSRSFTWNSPSTSDACGLFSWAVSYAAGTPAPSSVPTGGPLASPLSLPTTATFFPGETIVTYTSTDGNGNTAICSFTVTVNDTEAPTVVCQNISVELDAMGNATISSPMIDNGSSDNCDIAGMSISPASFNCSNVGDNTVTLTVTDVNGLSASCTAIVTVSDVTNPVAVCQDTTVYLSVTGMVTIDSSYVNDNSTDACGIATMSLSETSFDCSKVGVNPVTLTVTDVNGNIAMCMSNVTVLDTVPPLAVCQATTVYLSAAGMVTIDSSYVNDNSTDACGIATISLSETSFDCSKVGANPVTLTVTDVNGNVSTCMSIVTVLDTVPPVAVCQDTTVYLSAAGMVTIDSSYVNDNSTDVCGIATISLSETSFDCSKVGVNPVTLTVTDVNGNVSTCMANVTVLDTVPPVAICQATTV
jgi:hypothetical protein